LVVALAAVSGRAIAAMERTARRVPEVMVRATGRQHGGHVLANFSYISRLGHGEGKQVALYTSDEEVLHDARDMQILAQDWQEWEMGGDARRKGATSISMILSMPAGRIPSGCVMLHWISRAKNLPIGRGWPRCMSIAIILTFT
jgi:hypothetical protein